MKNRSIIGIIGTRSRDSYKDFIAVLEKFKEIYKKGDWICSGGCPKGGDRFAEKIARQYGCPIIIFHANWKIGKHAGFIRNSDIAKFSTKALIACVSKNRKGGTEDTIKKWERIYLDKEVIIC